MKVLIDARFYGLENAGLGRYTINLLDQLQVIDPKNHYVILLRKKYFEDLKLNKNFEKVLANISHYSLREQIELPKIIKKHNPDVTHFLHFNVPISFNEKFVVTIHDMTMHNQKTDSSNLFLPVYYLKHFFYKKVFKNAILKSKKIIVPSQFVKNELVKNFKIQKQKVEVTYEGIGSINSNFKNSLLRTSWPVDSFLENSRNGKSVPYFMYVGNAYPHKNLEGAIKAAINLKVNFYIVSSRNVFTKRLEEVIEKVNGKEYVKLLGFVEDEDLQKLYKNATGFIFPSLSEGFGLPGLEAMKAGTIVLASDIAVFKEVYKDNVVYFDPTSLSAVENTMQQVMNMNKTEREKRIKKAQEFVKKYSWEKMAKETLEVYESFLG